MTGHNSRRYRFTKRTHQNQDLGPLHQPRDEPLHRLLPLRALLQGLRGGEDPGSMAPRQRLLRSGRGWHLESEFSGNLVEVCPTGVFTDKTHSERYNRKWDMQFAPASAGGARSAATSARVSATASCAHREPFPRCPEPLFLCDRGRFGYGHVNLTDRPRQPLLQDGSDKLAITVDGALNRAADALRTASGVIGIGSPRASFESNFALRELVGAANFYSGVEQSEWKCLQKMLDILEHGGVRTPSLRDMEEADAVLVLGKMSPDRPRIALALRQAVKGKQGAKLPAS